MNGRIAALALAGIALLAGPALAMGSDGGCNWSAYFQSAATDAPEAPAPILTDDARG